MCSVGYQSCVKTCCVPYLPLLFIFSQFHLLFLNSIYMVREKRLNTPKIYFLYQAWFFYVKILYLLSKINMYICTCTIIKKY